MRGLLRPPGHRLPLIAAGAVPWALGWGVLDLRMDDRWSPWVLALLLAFAGALPLALALAAREDATPPVASLFVAGLALALFAVGRLTDALGADGAYGSPAALCLGAGALTALAAAGRARRRVPILVLIVAVGVGTTLVALLRWAFPTAEIGADRALLLVLALAFLVAHAQVRDRTPREGVLLLCASGLAILVLASTFVGIEGAFFTRSSGYVGVFSFGLDAGAGWQVVLLLAGFGLAAFAAVEREPGPGYLALALFAAFADAAGDHPSVLWWPLLLVAAGALAIGMGLRPARPLPPEPTPPGGPGETVPLPER